MGVHTWEDPEIHQTQTVDQENRNDWPRETQKKYPLRVIQITTRVRLSLSLPVCLSTLRLFFLLINTLLVSLLFVSMWKFISTQLTSQGLVPGGLVAKTQHSLCSGLTSTSGLELKSCIKPPTGWGQLRSALGKQRSFVWSPEAACMHLKPLREHDTPGRLLAWL